MTKLPPLWRDYDGLGQIASPPGHLTLLAWPHLYPFLSRLPVLLVSGWHGAAHPRSLQFSINRWIELNDGGLLLLVAAQQLCLIFSLALLTVSCSRRPLVRCLTILVFLCSPVLFVAAQLISSEALALILTLALIAVAVELLGKQELSRNGVIALGLCLYANIMTRHQNAIFAALLPLAFLFAAVVRVRDRSARRAHLKKFFTTCVIGLSAIVAANLTTRALCVVLREPYRSVVARTAIYRLDLIDRLPAPDKDAYLHKLEVKASDPITREAIPAILTTKGYWGDSMRVVEDLIKRRGERLEMKTLHARADYYLSEICLLYYQSPPPVVLRDIEEAIVRSLIWTTPTEVLGFLYTNAEQSLELYRSKPVLRKRTAHLESCSANAQSKIQRARTNWWLRGFDGIACGITFAVILVLAILLRCFGRFKAEALHLLVALGIVNALMMIGTLALTPYLPRFVLPSCVINVAAIAILLGGIDNLFPRLPSRVRST